MSTSPGRKKYSSNGRNMSGTPGHFFWGGGKKRGMWKISVDFSSKTPRGGIYGFKTVRGHHLVGTFKDFRVQGPPAACNVDQPWPRVAKTSERSGDKHEITRRLKGPTSDLHFLSTFPSSFHSGNFHLNAFVLGRLAFGVSELNSNCGEWF